MSRRAWPGFMLLRVRAQWSDLANKNMDVQIPRKVRK
jgi:hypothetical protein